MIAMTNDMELKIANINDRMNYLIESANGTAYVIEMIGDLLDKREIVVDYDAVHDEQTKRVVQANDYLLLQLENVMRRFHIDANNACKEFEDLSNKLTGLQKSLND